MSDDWDETPMPTLTVKPVAAPVVPGWGDEPSAATNGSNWKDQSSFAGTEGDGGDECTEQVEIDPGKVGRIVGKAGATINQLQTDFSVKIDIEKEDNANYMRDVKVTGSRGNVDRALAEIKKKTADFVRRENNDTGFSNFNSAGGDHRETIEVEVGNVGRIVGKAGATIKQLQDDHKVRIDIKKEDNMNGNRDVEVSGAEDDVVKAVTAIKAMLSGSGGFGTRGGDGGDGDKPREIYVPNEPTENGDELFQNNIKAGINFKNFDNIQIKMTGDNGKIYKPLATFQDANLRQIIVDNVMRAGYDVPTPVQKYSIPIMIAGRDLMACAQTGSGKTASFLLPIINQLMVKGESAEGGSIRALVVTPTRELAIQIYDEARKFSMHSWIKVSLAYGGVQTSYQVNKIQQGCHILVATPGRLRDLVNKGVVSYNSLNFLVLDEADRMLDMGFKTSIEEICNHPTYDKSQVQVAMFSATFPHEIQVLAAAFLKEHVFLTVGVVGSASTDVTQKFLEVQRTGKKKELHNWLTATLKDGANKRVLVFTETKKTTDFLASYMTEMNISSTSIHGDRLQREREMAINEFKQGKRKVLIATSVAARGLDIKDVSHVVNYDLPSSIDDYVHRIGRTGRVGNLGSAMSFFDPERDSEIRSKLVDILQQSGQEIPDFLGSGTCAGVSGANQFGGEDIRATNAGAPQEVADEEW